jgi:hypothetical protein
MTVQRYARDQYAHSISILRIDRSKPVRDGGLASLCGHGWTPRHQSQSRRHPATRDEGMHFLADCNLDRLLLRSNIESIVVLVESVTP